MSYQSLDKANERYQVAVFAVLVGLFLVAWAFMFVHPSVTLLIFWLGLIVAGLGGFGERMILRAERKAARKTLRQHACPRCGAEVFRDADQWHCGACGADFLDSGALRTTGAASP